MPTTLVGLVLFVVLLAPGLAYVARARITQPIAKPSALREAARLSLISLACDTAALFVFGLVRLWLPHHTPDVPQLVRDPGGYAIRHYVSLTVWGVALLLLAVFIALTGAVGLDSAMGRHALDSPLLRKLRVRGGEVTDQPAWWTWLNSPYRTYIQCELDDGSVVSGYLASFSAESDETSDRDLVLGDEVSVRPPGESTMSALDVSGLIVSARTIRWLSFTYIGDPEPEPRTSDSAGRPGVLSILSLLIAVAVTSIVVSAVWWASLHR